MKLRLECELENCLVNRDDDRKVLGSFWFDGSRMIATNGHILAALKVEKQKGDLVGYVPRDIHKEARSLMTTTAVAGKKIILKNDKKEVQIERPTPGKYPSWMKVIPKYKKPITVVFNFYLLKKLFEALGGNDKVFLTIDGNPKENELKAITVSIKAKTEDIGILMPMRP
jgi:hypothetical protein